MARTLESFDFSQPSYKHPRGESYPWGTWYNGEIWEIAHGEDFKCEPLMMERQIRTRASTRGLRTKIRHTGPGTIVFQATSKEEDSN